MLQGEGGTRLVIMMATHKTLRSYLRGLLERLRVFLGEVLGDILGGEPESFMLSRPPLEASDVPRPPLEVSHMAEDRCRFSLSPGEPPIRRPWSAPPTTTLSSRPRSSFWLSWLRSCSSELGTESEGRRISPFDLPAMIHSSPSISTSL